MIRKINIGKCCHSRSSKARFDAEAGDVVLIKEDGICFEGKIVTILSKDLMAVLVASGDSQRERQIAKTAILTLMLGD